jgi:hypothetical protein
MDEMWDSDLGVMITAKDVWPVEAKESTFSVTDIRRIEPDQKLFEIPYGARPEVRIAPSESGLAPR